MYLVRGATFYALWAFLPSSSLFFLYFMDATVHIPFYLSLWLSSSSYALKKKAVLYRRARMLPCFKLFGIPSFSANICRVLYSLFARALWIVQMCNDCVIIQCSRIWAHLFRGISASLPKIRNPRHPLREQGDAELNWTLTTSAEQRLRGLVLTVA